MLSRLAVFCAAACLLPAVAAFTQSVTFSTTAYPNNNLWNSSGGLNHHAHADLNGDGREDFISINNLSFNSGCTGSFAVTLSKGDGSYASPVCYTLPDGDAINFAVGDFYDSGIMDVVVATDDGEIYVYRNDGSGTLSLASSIIIGVDTAGMVAADVNHDGNEDLVYAVNEPSQETELFVLFGSLNGLGSGSVNPPPAVTFGLGPTSQGNQPVGGLDIGDFDDDGHVDILATTGPGAAVIENEILYGDGKGNFTAGPVFGNGATVYAPVPYLSDGTMSLIGAPYVYNQPGGSVTIHYTYLDIEQGHSNRTLTSTHVSLKACTSSSATPVIADFNGDGINDILVVEDSDCKGDGPYNLDVLLGNSDGTFQPEQVISSSADLAYEYHVVRASHSDKPDLVAFTGAPDGSMFADPAEEVLVNTTSGAFPACAPPDYSAEGINICSPTSVTGSISPVTFTIGGSVRTPARDTEIWVDGAKLAETHKGAYSYYGSITASLVLHNGTHTINVNQVGWDYSSISNQFFIDVGNNTCKPGTNSVNICSPIDSSTVASPVTAYAAGKIGDASPQRMEVWVDGVKQFTTTGSDSLKTALKVSPGWHQFTYYMYSDVGQQWSASSFVAVTAP